MQMDQVTQLYTFRSLATLRETLYTGDKCKLCAFISLKWWKRSCEERTFLQTHWNIPCFTNKVFSSTARAFSSQTVLEDDIHVTPAPVKLMHTIIFSSTSTCEPMILSKETSIFSQSASKCLSLQSRPNVRSKTFSLPKQHKKWRSAQQTHLTDVISAGWKFGWLPATPPRATTLQDIRLHWSHCWAAFCPLHTTVQLCPRPPSPRITTGPSCPPLAALRITHFATVATITTQTSVLNIRAAINRFKERLSSLTTCFIFAGRHESKQNHSTLAWLQRIWTFNFLQLLLQCPLYLKYTPRPRKLSHHLFFF